MSGTHPSALKEAQLPCDIEHQEVWWPAGYASDDGLSAIILSWLLTKHRFAPDSSPSVSFEITAPYPSTICLQEMALEPTRGAGNLLEDIKHDIKSQVSPTAASVTELVLSDKIERQGGRGDKTVSMLLLVDSPLK
jgi:hypothetical protein